jgi:dienelactone hydrolase
MLLLFPRFLTRVAGVLVLLAGLGGSVHADESGEGETRAPQRLAALEQRLAEVVDRFEADARQEGADELARDDEVSLEDWLEVMRGFGRFEAVAPGLRVEPVPLVLADRTDDVAVYVPSGYDPAVPTPLLLALHGAGGRGEDVVGFWREVADAVGLFVVAPTAPGGIGYGFTDLERGEGVRAVRWARRRFNVDESRVYVAGISRGGHMAWDLALRYPDRFGALVAMVGGPRLQIPGGQNNLRYVENVAPMAIRDLQGREDDPRLIVNLQMAFERLFRAGAPDAELLLQRGHGHGFDETAVDWVAFFGSARRDPSPSNVVRLAAREGEGRAFWVEVLAYDRAVKEQFEVRVDPDFWAGLGQDGQRRYVQAMADERTARIEARRVAVGRFTVTTTGVRRFRLLLRPEDLDADGRVEVRHQNRRVRRRIRPSKEVLLREFVERFDRTFLPVAEIEIR